MKRLLVFVLSPLLIIVLGSYGLLNHKVLMESPIQKGFSKVEFETILQDTTLNVRALEVVNDEFDFPVYLTSNGEFGIIYPNSIFKHIDSLKDRPYYNHKINLSNDTLKLNFRSLALTKKGAFGISIGSPAFLYKLDVEFEKIELVYQDNHEAAFYDSMEFWNEQEGIAIGDSTDGCLSVIITRDGGSTWKKLTCNQLPEGIEGEGAFAASDTNIAIVGDKTWVATTTGRIYYSADKGISWETMNTPIVKDKETEGIYSIDFYDEKNGFGIGGDYTKPADSSANKIRTRDGGKTWQLVAENESPGYRSCIQYVPNGKADELIAVGFKGIDYSNDGGDSWKHLSDEGFYTLRFLNDSVAYAAGRGRISKLTFR